jgi:ankyrin repeat protein
MLLEHGADVESRDKLGRTLLLLAIQNGRGIAAVQLIYQGGTHFELSQADSVTQLLFAVVQGQRMAVEKCGPASSFH